MDEMLALIDRDAALEVPREAAALMNAFLSDRCESTKRAYYADFKDFSRFLGIDTPEDAAWVIVARGLRGANALSLAYKASMMDRGLSTATIARRLRALRSLVKTARFLGLVNWPLEVDVPRLSQFRDTRGPGLIGIRRMLDQLDGDGAKDRRDRAILRLLFDLALRRGEVVSLDMKHLEGLDGEEASIWVRGKGQTERQRLSLPEPTRRALLAWLECRGEGPGPVFLNFDKTGKGGRLTGGSVYRIVRELGEQVGIKTWPHAIRHTAITEAVKKCQESGYPFELACEFSRHRDVRTLLLYRDRDRDAQGEIAKLVASSML